MAGGFGQLTDHDIRWLTEGLKSGHLRIPISAMSLQPALPADRAQAAADAMAALVAGGVTSEVTLRLFLEALAGDRASRPEVSDAVELVATGPTSAGVTCRDTSIVVSQLFANAETTVLVAGYAVYQGRSVFRSLADRMESKPSLQVRMFLDVQRGPGDTTRPQDLLARFAERFKRDEWPGSRLPEVYYDPRSLDLATPKRTSLHAKCVVVDRYASFVSSANFTEAAQNRNIEIGVLIQSNPFAEQLAGYFEILASHGILRPVQGF